MTKARSKKPHVVVETPPAEIDYHDYKRQQFYLAYSEWRAAQAEVARVSACVFSDASNSDDLMTEALERQEKAIHALLATPCGAIYQLMCQSALNIDPVSASKSDPLFGVIGGAPGGDARSREA